MLPLQTKSIIVLLKTAINTLARRVRRIIIFRRYTWNSDACNAVPRIVRSFFRQQETGTTTSPPRIMRHENAGLVAPRAATKLTTRSGVEIDILKRSTPAWARSMS
jgi:hypothetical protein